MERLFDEEIEINGMDWDFFTVSIGPIGDRKPRRPQRMHPDN